MKLLAGITPATFRVNGRTTAYAIEGTGLRLPRHMGGASVKHAKYGHHSQSLFPLLRTQPRH